MKCESTTSSSSSRQLSSLDRAQTGTWETRDAVKMYLRRPLARCAMNQMRGRIRARIVRKVVEARGIGRVRAQFLAGQHKLVDAIQLQTPLLQFFGFLFVLLSALGDRLVANGKMSRRQKNMQQWPYLLLLIATNSTRS